VRKQRIPRNKQPILIRMDISKIISDAPFLDSQLDREECAAWLKVTPDWLASDAMRTEPAIPVFKIGHRTLRYHPRTVLAVLAQRARVSPTTIAASFGLEQKGN
jgi:hypothetical protein